MSFYKEDEYKPGNIWVTRKDLEAISELDEKWHLIRAKENIFILEYVYEKTFFREHVKFLYDNQIFYICGVDVAHCFKTNLYET